MGNGQSGVLSQMHRKGMKMRIFKRTAVAAAVAVAVMAIGIGSGGGTVARAQGAPGAVYTLTNEVEGNQVAVFDRAADGTLTAAGTFATGGIGIAGGLGSQGALVLSGNNQMLFAVNAGSNDISVLGVRPNGLELLDRAASGGFRPTSITVHGDLVYVLNAGGAGNITGFRVAADGLLRPIENSTRPLSGNRTSPAQVSFSPDGRVLVVTERATRTIDTYTVGQDGRAEGPMTFASAGATPFGFAFDQTGRLFVSEAADSSLSSYSLSGSGALTTITPALSNTQMAACWAVVTQDGRFVYTANAGTGTVSGYRIAADGSVTLLNADGRTGITEANPTDMALSSNSEYLYVLTGSNRSIRAFRVGADGSLTDVMGASNLVAGAVGLAAR
jgi:6-phosphogluconolactonase